MEPPAGTTLREEAGLEAILAELAEKIAQGRCPGGAPLALVGVRTRGVPIAERIAGHLNATPGLSVPVGAVDITLYRDDLGRGDRWPVLRGTEIPFDVEGTEIVLVDDVLFTGRTVRAAINTVCDLGRPACVRLAVVVDRGGRELPIRADYVGLRCEAGPDERVVVRIRPRDETEGVFRVPRTGPVGG
jgi:pyrimidine operon attenuation protein/uracil phosphoribosyltransferase